MRELKFSHLFSSGWGARRLTSARDESQGTIIVRDKPDPGHFIRQHLQERGWQAGHLTPFLNRPAREISEIIGGYREITPEIAAGLAKAFDTTPSTG